MSGQFTVSAVMRLVDQFSTTGNKAVRMYDSIGRAARRASQTAGTNLRNIMPKIDDAAITRMVNKSQQRIQAARGRLMDALAMGTAIVAPVIDVARSEHQLAHLGNVGNMTAAQIANVGVELRARGAEANQVLSQMIEGYDYLLGKGMSGDLFGITESAGKTATATGADIRELSALAYAAVDNLGIADSRIKAIFDKTAKGGKEGGFELKDMAKHFPGITASAKALGMEGEAALAKLTAALQIAVKGAGNTDEAANNFKNFLAKMASPEVVKAFKKKGIDLRAELDNALANGVDPMEYLLVRLHDLSKDDKWATSDLFGDMQVQNFLKPMLQQLEEYRRIRDSISNADGVIDADFARVMDTVVERWKAFVIQLQLANSASGGLSRTIKDALQSLTGAVAAFNAFAAAHPELTDNVVKTVAAVLALGVATRVLGYAWALTGGAAVGAIRSLWGLKAVSSSVGNLSKALGSLSFNGLLKIASKVGAIRRFAASLMMIGRLGGGFAVLKAAIASIGAVLAGVSAPVLAVAAALAAAAFVIWKYWQPLAAFFSGLFDGFAEAGAEAADAILNAWGWAIDAISGLIDSLGETFGFDAGAVKEAIAAVFDFSWVDAKLAAVKDAVSGFFSDLFTPVELTDDQLFNTQQLGKTIGKKIAEIVLFIPTEFAKIYGQLYEIGANWGSALFEGIKETFSGVGDWIEGKLKKLKFWEDEEADPKKPANIPQYTPVPTNPTKADLEGVLGSIENMVPKRIADAQAVEKNVDQSKHVQQANTYNITVNNNGPAMLAGAVKSTASNANNQALRDID